MKRLRRGGNILTFGIVLLVILGASLLFIGRLLNDIGAKLNKTVVTERGRMHLNIIEAEFSRTAGIVGFAVDYLSETGAAPGTQAMVADIVFRLDPKISRVWFMETAQGKVVSCFRDSTQVRGAASPAETEAALRAAGNTTEGAVSGILHSTGGTEIWSISGRLEDASGRSLLVGVDIPLPELYAYMSAQNVRVMSYATVFGSNGTVVLHPDSLLIGSAVAGDQKEIVGRVGATGTAVDQTFVSEFLGLPVERFYYPLDIAGERWVAAISVPWITIEEEMEAFHLYMAVIAVIAVLLFSALLAFSQSRWRREHEKRMAAERHSSELQVQRIIDQINPHFLFNSLNSLYSLINSDPKLAREFVLKLSGVYRYVLDRRTETLSTVRSEVDFIKQYIFLQKIRFGDQIEVMTDIDRGLYDRLIPSMSLQTLVENAVKHNNFTSQEPLMVSIYTTGESLVVENNCSPRTEKGASTGLGLERLRSIYVYYTDQQPEVVHSESLFMCILPLIAPPK